MTRESLALPLATLTWVVLRVPLLKVTCMLVLPAFFPIIWMFRPPLTTFAAANLGADSESLRMVP